MEQLKRELTRILQQYAEEGCYSNAVIAVFNRERVCFRLTYGETSPESVFDLASLTKLYTTTVLLKLLQERDIGVDTPVLKMLETPEECRQLRARLDPYGGAARMVSAVCGAWDTLGAHGVGAGQRRKKRTAGDVL